MDFKELGEILDVLHRVASVADLFLRHRTESPIDPDLPDRQLVQETATQADATKESDEEALRRILAAFQAQMDLFHQEMARDPTHILNPIVRDRFLFSIPRLVYLVGLLHRIHQQHTHDHQRQGNEAVHSLPRPPR